MSKTPRTDAEFKLEAFFDGTGIVETVLVEFARQLETELAEAQTEVERLALEIENQQYTITCASEENQQLKESLAEARAEIENLKWHINSEKAKADAALALNDRALELVNEARADADHWKSECNALQRMVHEARAEIEKNSKLIERMKNCQNCGRTGGFCRHCRYAPDKRGWDDNWKEPI